MIRPVGRWKRRESVDRGCIILFGSCGWGAGSVLAEGIRTGLLWGRLDIHQLRMDLFHPDAGIEPSPTIVRHVSGNKSTRGMKKMVDDIARNQNIDCHPRYSLRTPPRTGPSEGARMFPKEVMLIYVPRSAEVMTSAATAEAKATVPLLPEL